MSDRYWDTVCFLGVLNEEQDKLSACRAVIGEAERGNVRIVTSALTIAEPLRVRVERVGQTLVVLEQRAAIGGLAAV